MLLVDSSMIFDLTLIVHNTRCGDVLGVCLFIARATGSHTIVFRQYDFQSPYEQTCFEGSGALGFAGTSCTTMSKYYEQLQAGEILRGREKAGERRGQAVREMPACCWRNPLFHLFLLASSTQMLPRCILPVNDGWGLPLFLSDVVLLAAGSRRNYQLCSYADGIR